MKLTIYNYQKIKGVKYSSQWYFSDVFETDDGYSFVLEHKNGRGQPASITIARNSESDGKWKIIYGRRRLFVTKDGIKDIHSLIRTFQRL